MGSTKDVLVSSTVFLNLFLVSGALSILSKYLGAPHDDNQDQGIVIIGGTPDISSRHAGWESLL